MSANPDFIAIISQVGFPIAISVYLLYERSKNMKANTEMLVELRLVIEKLCNKLNPQ